MNFFQTKYTMPKLPNQTYQSIPSKPNLKKQSCQAKPTKSSEANPSRQLSNKRPED